MVNDTHKIQLNSRISDAQSTLCNFITLRKHHNQHHTSSLFLDSSNIRPRKHTCAQRCCTRTCVVHGMPSTKPMVQTPITARTRYCQWRTNDCHVSIIPVIIVSTPTICTDICYTSQLHSTRSDDQDDIPLEPIVTYNNNSNSWGYKIIIIIMGQPRQRESQPSTCSWHRHTLSFQLQLKPSGQWTALDCSSSAT